MPLIKIDSSAIRRFWEKVDKKEDHECWRWTGYIAPGTGNGQLTVKELDSGKHIKEYARRISMIIHTREQLPDSAVVSRKENCRYSDCVNPAHLHIGSRSEPAIVLHSRGDRHRSDDYPREQIIAAYTGGDSVTVISERFGITPRIVYLILSDNGVAVRSGAK